MAKLCENCAKKKVDTSVRGSCVAPQAFPRATLSDKHNPWTESPSYSFCEACSDQFKLCALCLGPLDGHGGINVPTEKQFCRQFPDDNGNHVTDMYVGEQILAQMPFERFSGVTWGIDYLSPSISRAGGRLVGIPSGEDDYWSYYYGPQNGWLEMYFDLNEGDPKGVIRLVERPVYNWWWTPVIQNPKTWEITVEIKH